MLDNPSWLTSISATCCSRMAESQPDPARARPFLCAVDEYNRVLKLQPGQMEAVNNKAWVLHIYLGRSQEALETMKEVIKQVDPAVLPGEFYDTLGDIQETVGRRDDAEQSYLKGLKKTPEHPVLNYHFGKLIATDRSRRRGPSFIWPRPWPRATSSARTWPVTPSSSSESWANHEGKLTRHGLVGVALPPRKAPGRGRRPSRSTGPASTC